MAQTFLVISTHGRVRRVSFEGRVGGLVIKPRPGEKVFTLLEDPAPKGFNRVAVITSEGHYRCFCPNDVVVGETVLFGEQTGRVR